MQTWTKKIITRKSHQCHGCGFVYGKGSKMEYSTNVDGGFIHSYWCKTCVAVMDSYSVDDRDDGYCVGDIYNSDPELWCDVNAEVVGIEGCLECVEYHIQELPPPSRYGSLMLIASWKKIRSALSQGVTSNVPQKASKKG